MFDSLMKIGTVTFVMFGFALNAQAQTDVRSDAPSSIVQEETVTPEPNGTEPHIESIGNDPAGPPETTGPATLIPSGEPVFIESIGNDPANPVDESGPNTPAPAITKPEE